MENIWGNMKLHGRQMEFEVSQATISGTNLDQASFRVADISDPNAMLNGELEASGATRQFVKLAVETVAKGWYNDLVDRIPVSGNGKLMVQFDVPLQGTAPIKLSGNYEFIDNQLDLGRGIPDLAKINGVMPFSESGVKLENITAQLLGGPVLISSTSTADGSMRVSALGKIDLDHVRARDGLSDASPAWLRYLQGGTEWQANAHLNNGMMQVTVESTLRGITSNLPEPFSKTAPDTSAPFRFERKAISSEKDRLIFSYGSTASAKIARSRDGAGKFQIETGTINLGATSRYSTDKAGVSVTGALPTLNLDRWRNVLVQLKDEPELSPNVAHVHVHIGAVDFLGKRFHDLTLNADKKDGMWHSAVVGNEINGEVRWDPSANGKVVARLHRLAIPADSFSKSAIDVQKRQQSKTLPTLDVSVETFLIGDKQLGKLELIAAQEEQGWRVEKLRVTSPHSSIMLRGLSQSRAGSALVQADVTLEATDIGKFLTHLGIPERVKRGSGKLEGTLSWYGNPLSIDYPTLSGAFKLNAKRGEFPKFEPGIGRLFGIFNLQTFPRRITLDFYDVFSEGLAFDDISGEVKIARGQASTEGLRIEGPSAKIVMNGEMNLETETQKLHIKVNPSYGLAAPVVGMASVIANTALQNPATSKEYNITGSWADPIVSRITRREREPAEHEH
jgi:uncharacterized protein (TIGR02099 family)